ncbi:activin receptor type-2A isoform X2 [Cylas formicarius]|uniref:activin receptor type-2A isoform X2 n=1 Tax=Cylas formicarius TaxID=197179 RepID=UPI00295845CB|nr:activin receptor type-2A isoform X2 [Cylas formicarius]
MPSLVSTIMYLASLLILGTAGFSAAVGPTKDYILCAHSKTRIEDDSPLDSAGVEEQFIKCNDSYCYTLWQDDGNNRSVVMGQGCWVQSGQPNDCDKSECLADRRPPRAINNTKFCCCSKDMCNINFTDTYVPVEEPPSSDSESTKKENVNPLIYTALGMFFFIVILITGTMSYYFWKRRPKKSDIENNQPLPPPPDYSLDKLKLLNVIGQGKYGCVWHGQIEQEEVAVKIFPAHNRTYFYNEHEIYKMAGEHPSIVKCFGGGEYVRIPGHPDYLLLLGLERESLQEYLKNNTPDLLVLSKMGLDIAKGLAHLHSDLGKPCIAHRDLNTKNILVRADLSCCICDLGLAVIPKRSENKALSEAGTLRYMAPEVLEGAVNLCDCGSALKQIDVYALGLVLWELGTRCVDTQNAEPSPYCPPFFKETGENPTLEQMQTLVSRRKVRPLWPVSWKDTAAARLLCETAEDCWDQDAEARLTSLCVVERFLELPNLRGRVLHPVHPPASPTPLINNNHLREHPIEVSAATVETLLSPSDDNRKNSNQLAALRRPHHGRNPCLERNLLSDSCDDLLVDKSSKHVNSSESRSLVTNEVFNFQINSRAAPIPYLQNAVLIPKRQNDAGQAAQTASRKRKFKWGGLKNFWNPRKFSGSSTARKDTQVKLRTKSMNGNGVTTALLADEGSRRRPSTLSLAKSPDNSGAQCSGYTMLKRKDSLSRQSSLEQFREVFSSATDLSRLKDPSRRVKTPGDVPPSVRRTRGKAAANSARFSLYDDSLMGKCQWGSAPDLEPRSNEQRDKDSVSSF